MGWMFHQQGDHIYATEDSDDVLHMPAGSYTIPADYLLKEPDVLVRCQICQKVYVNPPAWMTAFPVCDDCLNFFRTLKERADEFI